MMSLEMRDAGGRWTTSIGITPPATPPKMLDRPLIHGTRERRGDKKEEVPDADARKKGSIANGGCGIVSGWVSYLSRNRRGMLPSRALLSWPSAVKSCVLIGEIRIHSVASIEIEARDDKTWERRKWRGG
jgi:hypothetical protein